MHVYERPGTYQASLTVTDDSGSLCATASDLLVVRVNNPPTADAGADLDVFTGGANDVVTLDGSGSSDADGDDLSFHWQIGDAIEVSEQRVQYRFRQPGEHQARLMVTDGTGLPCGTDTSVDRIRVRER